MNKQYESAKGRTSLEEQAASAIDYINEDVWFWRYVNSRQRFAVLDLMKYASHQLRMPSCMRWSAEDIVAQAQIQGLEVDINKANELLYKFFEENNGYLVEIINYAMEDFVHEKLNPEYLKASQPKNS